MENSEGTTTFNAPMPERSDVNDYLSSFGKSYGTYGIVVAAIVAIIIPALLSFVFMGKKKGKKRGVPVEVGGEAGYAVRNALMTELVQVPWAGATTMATLFEQCCKKYSRDRFIGTRKLIKRDFVTASNGKKFEKLHLGDYEWQTYGQVYHRVCNFASGLVTFGHNVDTRAAIFSETRGEWQITCQGCFRQNITVVTIYASLGEDALIHSLNETQVSTLICDSKQLKKLAAISSSLKTITNIIYFEDDETVNVSDLSGSMSDWKVSSFLEVEKLGERAPVPPSLPNKPDKEKKSVSALCKKKNPLSLTIFLLAVAAVKYLIIMAIAVANCCFSVLSSTVKFRYSVSCNRHLATSISTSHASLFALSTKATNNKKRALKRSSSTSPLRSNAEKDNVSQKKLPGRSKDEKSSLYADGISGRGNMGRPQSPGFKSFGTQRKDKKEFQLDSREQQVEPGHLQDATFLNAVVKVYCTHTTPDYSLPWQKQRQYTSTGSAFMIGDGKLLTNAHCVEHDTQVKVKRRDDDTKYVAKVLARGVDCDIALLSVESEEFWKGAEPLRLGHLPCLQDAVTVVGYPLGGDTISVTKGVVSRIEVTSYAHGSSDLLGIQIDAAINPGNSGGPAFNEQGECIGVAFQVYRSEEAENIGYVIPTTVVSHFLNDYERNGKYTGFPCLGVLVQKLENPALRACLQVQSNEGVLVRRVEPTSDANNVLKEGDVIVSFDDVHVGSEGTVLFRSNERIAFRYLISQKFAGDVAEIGIIRAGKFMKIQVVLNPRVHLVPYHIDGGQPSYLIIAGLVFTPLSEPLIQEECEDSIGLKLLAKARYSLARFKGEQIVILSQVLANEVNIGYEDMGNQQVLKFNGTRIKNICHLAHLVACCKDKYLVFEFEDNYVAVLEREAAMAASSRILKDYGIPSERSDDLLEPCVDSLGDNLAIELGFGDSPASNLEIGFDGLLWA